MLRHPREGENGPMSRRDFLRRSAGAAVAFPSAAAILAACRKRADTVGGGTDGVTIADLLARRDKPVTLPIFDDNPPIESGLSPEPGATLRVYNWVDYMRPGILDRFAKEFGVKVEFTKFHNMEIAIEKLASGAVDFDVFFPTTDVIPKLVVSKLLQPLNLDYIQNLQANIWPELADPFYDKGSRYSVPYTVYTTGIGFRRDHVVEDIAALPNPYEIFWTPDYTGYVGIYDSYRDATGFMMLKNGITDVNTGDQQTIDLVKQELLSLIDAVNIKTTINGAYARIPEDAMWLHQAWSGDIVYAQYQLPKGVSPDVLGYWFPEDGKGLIGSDTIAIPRSAKNPVLAHLFLNFMLDTNNSLYNFGWNLYQPPQNVIEPENLVSDGTIHETLKSAVVLPKAFEEGYYQGGLLPEVEARWLAAWNEFKAGV